MKASLRGEHVEQLSGSLAGIDDAKHFRQFGKGIGKRPAAQLARFAEHYAAELAVKRVCSGAKLLCFLRRRVLAQQVAKRGLRGGAQNSGRAEMRCEAGNCCSAGAQMRRGKKLRFIKDDDAVCKVMQLSALGRAVCINRFKKLDGCRYDDRHVPVFRRVCVAACGSGNAVLRVEQRAGMMLKYILIAEDFPEYGGSLLND